MFLSTISLLAGQHASTIIASVRLLGRQQERGDDGPRGRGPAGPASPRPDQDPAEERADVPHPGNGPPFPGHGTGCRDGAAERGANRDGTGGSSTGSGA